MADQHQPPRIAIIGGGPAGLTLALLLHRRSIPFTLYDLRPRPTAEEIAAPCGMLDLHEGTGLAAIRACGLWDDFEVLTGECEQSMILADRDAHVLLAETDVGGGARPEIARNKLSGILLARLPAASLRHNTKLVSAERVPGTGQVVLELGSTLVKAGEASTTSETFDLVVGADGAWSRVRPLLTDVKPTPTGVLLFTMYIKHISTRFPHLSELTGRGMFLCLGNKHMLSSHRSAQDSCFLYSMMSAPEDAATADLLSQATLPELKQLLLHDAQFYRDHAPVLRELLAVGFDEETTGSSSGTDAKVRPISMLPRDHRWAHRPGATLVGDAAHLMMPSGEGSTWPWRTRWTCPRPSPGRGRRPPRAGPSRKTSARRWVRLLRRSRRRCLRARTRRQRMPGHSARRRSRRMRRRECWTCSNLRICPAGVIDHRRFGVLLKPEGIIAW